MPIETYPCALTIMDVDGVTGLADVTVTAYSVTNEEWMPSANQVTTDASGEAILDLANFTTDLDDGDVVQIFAYTTRKHIALRHTVDSGVGALEQTMTLHDGEPWMDDTNVEAVSVANDSGSAITIEFYDTTNDVRRFKIECAANTTESVYFGKRGFEFAGGICIVFNAGADEATTSVAIKASVLA